MLSDKKNIKVALIGNMNNVFFTAMRYLRDLNLDAHLFMYTNEYSHFKPENDTYQIDKYKDFIHTLPVDNSAKGLILSKKNKIKKELKEFDIFIGCGVAPALFEKIGYQLDIFVPYADQIELTTQDSFKLKNIFKYHIRRYTVNQQIIGIKNTKKIIADAIQEKAKNTIHKLNLESKLIKNYTFSVYRENFNNNIDYKNLIWAKDLNLFSNIRHHWKNLTEEDKRKNGDKGVDKLIIGYSQFIKKHPNLDATLILFEYGRDINDSKELIQKLNIKKHVQWLPLMPRKKLLNLMKNADIVVGSLSDSMWGGVGNEAFSCGKILIQNLLQTDEEYEREMGHKIPFIMRCNSADILEKHLTNFIENKDFFIEKSKENQIWFDKYAGIGLAKEYKKVIENIYNEKIK